MPRKQSIHVGVNAVDAAAYPRVPCLLTAAEADAAAMRELTSRAGLAPTVLAGRAATRDAVGEALVRAAATLAAGDLLVLTFSGHGARYEDTLAADTPRPVGARNRRPGDDDDGFDECWCLWDGVLVDDDLDVLLAGFAPGVRIYVMSDSCYSGTILRRDATDKLRTAPEVRASVLLSAAAAESEVCFTGELCGQFTAAVLAAWDDGRFTGDHVAFHEAIRRRSAPGQVPGLGRYGVRSEAFERARPFGVP